MSATPENPDRGGQPGLGRRMLHAVLAVPRPFHAVLLVICFVLGAALVTQVRAQQTDPLDSLSEEDLVVLLSELQAREDTLRKDKVDLATQLSQLQNSVSQQQAADEAAKRATQQAQINSGVVAVHGQGVVMAVRDDAGALSATQFVMALGELRNAGAEAIALNGVRLTARSSFVTGDGGAVSVDGTTISSPFTWQVIGASDTISTALQIQAGSADQMRAKGATVTITEKPDVVIEAVASAPSPTYAKVE